MKTSYRGLLLFSGLSFLPFSAPFHLSAGNIAFFINEIEVPFFPLNAAFCYFLRVTAFFCTSSHLSAGNIAFLINVVEVPFLPLDA